MLCEFCNCDNNTHLFNCKTLEKIKVENTDMAINSFTGQFRFLSNFYTFPLEFEGGIYLSSEHAYQAAKTLNLEERIKFQHFLDEDISVLSSKGISHTNLTASEAKKAGSHLKLRSDWENIKLDIMEQLLRQKFSIESPLREKLDSTQGQILVEGNWWHDTFWGKCDCKTHKGKGENNLGKILMKIRNEK